MALKGKGFFTFRLPDCEGGDPAAIARAARAAGLSHVLVKIADGTNKFGFNTKGQDITAPVVAALKSAGIAVWGWHYVYGSDPAGEAHVAANRVLALGLDGYVIDAEAEYEQPGREAAARRFMNQLRNGLPHTPVALSAFRFPEYHPQFPWSVFLAGCDYDMPQVYWEQSHNAGAQLRESYKQHRVLPKARPFIATGAAYGVTGWEPGADEIADFLEAARSLGIEAVNFFAWDACRAALPRVWRAIAGSPWPEPSGGASVPADAPPPTPEVPPPAPAPVDFLTTYFEALNNRDALQVAALYAPEPLVVRADRALNGAEALRAAYAEFFSALPSDAAFVMTRSETHADLRSLSWVAGAWSGHETILLTGDRIRSHFVYLPSSA